MAFFGPGSHFWDFGILTFGGLKMVIFWSFLVVFGGSWEVPKGFWRVLDQVWTGKRGWMGVLK
jgi:hypothetical protein